MNIKRLILANYTDLKDSHLQKIVAVAKDFDVSVDKEDAANAEVIFGYVNSEIAQKAKNLKWLHVQSAGVEHYIAPNFGLDENVILTNSAGMHARSISEHMLAFTIMLMRHLHNYVKGQTAHNWQYLGEVKSVYNSNIAVVGLGGIGSLYASHCKALGANVVGVVRTAKSEVPSCVDKIFTADQLDIAIANADVVALTLPNTAETTALFNKERLQKLKKGVFIINIGRGTAIDQDALIELLESGHIGGAAMDVTTPEPLNKDSKLWDLPNVIITPHISGGGTLPLTTDLIVDRFIDYLQDYIAERPFKKVVDRKLGY
ncbi:MAG: D-2-hydroxyacid dehydrogenase [Firmicutes bacterium]|nr:D-2-hydroxyacid dehydrogenase [Bacillota bacterium]